MAKLTKECVETLTIRLLEEYPVWCWDDSNEFLCPVKGNLFPLPEDEYPLFIKADFVDALGNKLIGYLVGGDSFYAFGLLNKGVEYIFNLNLIDSFDKKIIDAYGENVKVKDVFPIKYSSEFYYEGEPPFSGQFDLENFKKK
jgi:hypothetical protein